MNIHVFTPNWKLKKTFFLGTYFQADKMIQVREISSYKGILRNKSVFVISFI